VVAAGAGQRRPVQYALDAFFLRQLRVVDRNAVLVEQRALPDEFPIPDVGLRVEIAKAAEDRQVDTLARRRFAHRLEMLEHVAMHGEPRFSGLTNVAAGSARQLQRIQHGGKKGAG
jgi:hypothetical protein